MEALEDTTTIELDPIEVKVRPDEPIVKGGTISLESLSRLRSILSNTGITKFYCMVNGRLVSYDLTTRILDGKDLKASEIKAFLSAAEASLGSPDKVNKLRANSKQRAEIRELTTNKIPDLENKIKKLGINIAWDKVPSLPNVTATLETDPHKKYAALQKMHAALSQYSDTVRKNAGSHVTLYLCNKIEKDKKPVLYEANMGNLLIDVSKPDAEHILHEAFIGHLNKRFNAAEDDMRKAEAEKEGKNGGYFDTRAAWARVETSTQEYWPAYQNSEKERVNIGAKLLDPKTNEVFRKQIAEEAKKGKPRNMMLAMLVTGYHFNKDTAQFEEPPVSKAELLKMHQGGRELYFNRWDKDNKGVRTMNAAFWNMKQ